MGKNKKIEVEGNRRCESIIFDCPYKKSFYYVFRKKYVIRKTVLGLDGFDGRYCTKASNKTKI